MTLLPNVKRKKRIGMQLEYIAGLFLILIIALQSLKKVFTGIFMIALLAYIGITVLLLLMPSNRNHGKRFYEQIIIYIRFKFRKWKEVMNK